MKKILLMAGAAAMAFGLPAAADPGKDESGKGRKGFERQFERQQKFEEQREKRAEKAFERRQKFAEQRGKEREKRFEREMKDREKWAEQREKAFERRAEASRRMAERVREDRRRDRDDRFDDDRFDDDRWEDRRDWGRSRGFCPPGLARKNNGCLPPGQAKKVYARGERFDSDWYSDYIPAGYRSLYYDTPDYYYRYDDDGYIYRVNRDTNLVSSLIPLLGGGFGVGQMLPSGYDIYNVPLQYRDVYYDTPDAYYRYGDNAIYQVDPQTQMIESVVALLAGDTLGVGQVLPAGYGAYNVPLDYRDRYYDTDEYMYRYADGNIYQIDAQTQIIQAIISALV